MSDWSYLHQYVKLRGKRAHELPALQERGADGWELVSAVPLARRLRKSANADVLLLFKRPQSSNGATVETADEPEEPDGAEATTSATEPVGAKRPKT